MGLIRLNCELFAGRSLYKQQVGSPRLGPRASGPPGLEALPYLSWAATPHSICRGRPRHTPSVVGGHATLHLSWAATPHSICRGRPRHTPPAGARTLQPLLLLLRPREDETVTAVSLGVPTRRESDKPDIASVVLEGHGPVSGPVAAPFAMPYLTLGSLRMSVWLLASSPSLRRSCLAAVRTRRESPDLRRPQTRRSSRS